MEIIKTRQQLSQAIALARSGGRSVAFVPTMGALHQGHLSLASKAKEPGNFVVCSIFVNRLQFNNQNDYLHYPVQEEEDIRLLNEVGCDLLFLPTHDEIYGSEVNDKYEFGSLGSVMEGMYRPGHFQGVAAVVKRLLEAVNPDIALFGEKDYQQLQIIRKLVSLCDLPVVIEACPTVREADGLAMSSRNRRLNDASRKDATQLFRVMSMMREMAPFHSPSQILGAGMEALGQVPGLRIEYLEIADPLTLLPVSSWGETLAPRIFVAAYAGDVRLIDNIAVFC